MRKITNVRGTQTNQPKPLQIGIDTVYVRENIVAVDEEGFKGWQYDETQYNKDEYIAIVGNKNNDLEQAVAELTVLVTMGGM